MIKNLALLLLIMVSGSFFVVLDQSDFLYILALIVASIGIVTNGKITIVRESIVRQIIMLALFVGLVFLRGDSLSEAYNLGVVLKLIIIIFLSMYLLSQDDASLLARLCSFFEVIALLSLITFVGANLAPFMMFNVGSTAVMGDFMSFIGLGYARSTDITKYGFIRNQGFFWEPGVLGFFTTFIYMIKTYRLSDYRRVWIYYVTVLSTISMGTGLIFLLVYFHNKYRSQIGWQGVHVRVGVIVSAIGIALVAANVALFMPHAGIELMGALFQRDLANDASVGTRWYDFYYGLRSALERPFIGWGRDFSGYYEMTLLELNRSKESYDGGITNSVISMLYMYGGIFLCYYLYLIYRLSKWVNKERRWFVLLIIFMLLMHEPLAFSMFVLFFITAFGTEKSHRIAIILRERKALQQVKQRACSMRRVRYYA